MIVPISRFLLDDCNTLQTVIFRHWSQIWASSYDDRPAKLFDGVEKSGLTIVIGKQSQVNDTSVCTQPTY